MQSNTNSIIGESWLYKKHSSGLNIFIVKKPGKSRIHAQITTRFGSINRNFICDGKTVTVKKGEGFAQGIFLEYGITEDDDVSEIRNGGFGSTTK